MTLPAVIRTAATPVWLALMALTALSLAVGGAHGTTVLVLAVAFVKVRFIGMYFMELRHAPLALRLLFDGWVVVVWAGLIVLYQTGG